MSHQMRLSPIEEPPSLMMRAVYAYSQRTFGKVLMPMKVIYARVPAWRHWRKRASKRTRNFRSNPNYVFWCR